MLKRMILMAGFMMVVMTTAAMAQSASTFDGKPEISKGDEVVYYVWRDGDQWHVRWTTDGTMRRFNGSVMSEGGELKSLKRIDVESESRVVRSGRAPRVVRGPRGRVVGVGGGRAPVVVTKEQDKIEKDGDHRIHFFSSNDGDIDGFDFKVDKNVTSLKFALEIGSKTTPRRIEVGKSNSKVTGDPFTVSLR